MSVGVSLAEASLGDLTGKSAVVVGAGSMSSLAATELRSRGIGTLSIVNRTLVTRRAAGRAGGRPGIGDAGPAQRDPHADVVVSCTGAVGTVISA